MEYVVHPYTSRTILPQGTIVTLQPLYIYMGAIFSTIITPALFSTLACSRLILRLGTRVANTSWQFAQSCSRRAPTETARTSFPCHFLWWVVFVFGMQLTEAKARSSLEWDRVQEKQIFKPDRRLCPPSNCVKESWSSSICWAETNLMQPNLSHYDRQVCRQRGGSNELS